MNIVMKKWPEILDLVKKEHELSDVSFNTWLKPLTVHSVENNVVTILVQSNEFITYISKKFTLPIKVSITEITGQTCEIRFITPEDVPKIKESQPQNAAKSAAESNLNEKYTFDTFVVGSNNSFAHAASLAVAESPGEAYNPLFIYGGVGLGKTHLMHSIAHYILENDPSKQVLYVTSETFTNELIDALKAGKHVLCEKPAARTYAEALEMQKAQKESGKVLNIGVVNRFNDAVNKIRQMIKDGELGEIYHVYVSFRSHRSIPGLGGDFTTNDISGGGVLIDWGVHFLDIVMYCTGDPSVKTVSSEAFCRLGKNIEEYTYVNMWAGPPKMDGTYDVDDSITGVIRTLALAPVMEGR